MGLILSQLRNIRCRLVAADGAYQFRMLDFFRHDWVFALNVGPCSITEKDLPDNGGQIRTRRYKFDRWEGKTAIFLEMID